MRVVVRDSIVLQSALFKGKHYVMMRTLGHLFGKVTIPLKLLLKGQETEQWYPLTRRKTATEISGYILLRLRVEV